MAGPTASVIVPDTLNENSIIAVAGIIEKIADSVNGREFAVTNRPFIWSRGTEDDFSEFAYANSIGWTPKDQILLSAMCNQPEDHSILAELCIHVSEKIGGLIDFGGTLQLPDERLSGKNYNVDYEPALVGPSSFHIGDREFLEEWRSKPEFHMIK